MLDTQNPAHRDAKGRYVWLKDADGNVHWRGAFGLTFCRRSVKGMRDVVNGELQLSCDACRDLRRIESGDFTLTK